MSNMNVRGFSERLNKALDRAGVPRKGKGRNVEVAKMFNVSPASSRKWLEAVGFPEMEKTLEITRALNVPAEWLLTGKGGFDVENAAPPPAIDGELLTEVIQTVFTLTDGLGLDPRMFSKLVEMVYEESLATRQVEEAAVRRLVRLVS